MAKKSSSTGVRRRRTSEKTESEIFGVQSRVTNALLEHAGAIADACGATAIFIYLDALNDATDFKLPAALRKKLCYVSKAGSDTDKDKHKTKSTPILIVPDVPMTRLGQIKIAIFLALSQGKLSEGDIVLFLAGRGDTQAIDSLIITEVGTETEMMSPIQAGSEIPKTIKPEVIAQVIDIATAIGSEGREGKSVGALFVIGDSEKVLGLSRQMILNPFRGYDPKERNILDESLAETIKELATVDGAFIIEDEGTIESCGVYLKPASQEEHTLPMGLGARHHAASAITALTETIAVTVSESTGSVTVFCAGKIAVEIERPHAKDTSRKDE